MSARHTSAVRSVAAQLTAVSRSRPVIRSSFPLRPVDGGLSSPFASPANVQRRTLFGGLFGSKKKGKDSFASRKLEPVLAQDDLFHPFSQSPFAAVRARGERVTSQAPCPVCLEEHGERRPAQYECPDCGWPTHCSPHHHGEDTEHARYCPQLRQANEDEHDLRSGRAMAEFEMPGDQPYEEAVNMANWDLLLYTRNFNSVESERSKRHVTKLLTFPISIGGILHQNSPYTTRNQRLTHEGLRSLAALRTILHPPLGRKGEPETVRLFILGARAESSLPVHVWEQISHLFPGVPFHIFLIGPEASFPASQAPSAAPRPSTGSTSSTPSSPSSSSPSSSSAGGSNSAGELSTSASSPSGRDHIKEVNYGVPSRTIVASEFLTLTVLQTPYEMIHEQFAPFDPYTDAFFAFSPGFGFPSQRTAPLADAVVATEVSAERSDVETPPSPPMVQAQAEWAQAIAQILGTKCALFNFGFSPADVERDVRAFTSVPGVAGEFDWVVHPGENVFASQKLEIAEFDPRVQVKANWGVWGVRGKRYEVSQGEEEEEVAV